MALFLSYLGEQDVCVRLKERPGAYSRKNKKQITQKNAKKIWALGSEKSKSIEEEILQIWK